MLVAERVFVCLLCSAVGPLLAGWGPPAPAPPFFFRGGEAPPADTALPAAGAPSAGANTHGPPPGLNVGIAFWRLRLGSLNRDEAAFEGVQWRITRAVMEAAGDYLETVVLPAVRHAEGGG